MFENPKLQFSQNSQPKNWILGHKTSTAQPLDLLSRYLLLSALRWNLCPGRFAQVVTNSNSPKPKKNETTSQPFTNMFKRTWSHARKAGFVMTTWGIFLRGFSNLQLGKTHFTTWFRSFHPAANNSYEMIPLNSTTSACELARVSNMARTRASLRWNVSPMAFSSCSTSWFSSCWFWIQKNQHFLP